MRTTVLQSQPSFITFMKFVFLYFLFLFLTCFHEGSTWPSHFVSHYIFIPLFPIRVFLFLSSSSASSVALSPRLEMRSVPPAGQARGALAQKAPRATALFPSVLRGGGGGQASERGTGMHTQMHMYMHRNIHIYNTHTQKHTPCTTYTHT